MATLNPSGFSRLPPAHREPPAPPQTRPTPGSQAPYRRCARSQAARLSWQVSRRPGDAFALTSHHKASWCQDLDARGAGDRLRQLDPSGTPCSGPPGRASLQASAANQGLKFKVEAPCARPTTLALDWGQPRREAGAPGDARGGSSRAPCPLRMRQLCNTATDVPVPVHGTCKLMHIHVLVRE